QATSDQASDTAARPAEPVIGIDLAGMDTSVQPGDDFEAYANGGWRETTEIPADRASTGIFLHVLNKAEQRTAELVQSIIDGDPPPGSDARRIADHYAAFMDTDTIEARRLEPAQPHRRATAAACVRPSPAARLGAHLRADVAPLKATDRPTPSLFGLFVTQGLHDPEHSRPYLLRGGTARPSRDYYVSGDKAMQ